MMIYRKNTVGYYRINTVVFTEYKDQFYAIKHTDLPVCKPTKTDLWAAAGRFRFF